MEYLIGEGGVHMFQNANRFTISGANFTVIQQVNPDTLSDMPYAKGAGHQPEKECLPNTRQGIIHEIIEWANMQHEASSSRIFWLNGVAGSGKSAIAHTVAGILEEQQLLGSFFAFDIAHQAERRPDQLFSTIAVDIAGRDAGWKTALWNIVKDDRALRTTRSIQKQFDMFLVATAKSADLKIVRPIVIVIDALDESGDEDSREDVLRMLAERITSLPSNFRICLTSRPERDINAVLAPCSHIYTKFMHTIDPKSTTNDISTFIRSQLHMSLVSTLNREWPDNAWLRLLVDKSEGLFQWASTACWFIKGTKTKVVLTPVERFKIILSSVTNLDSLYLEILKRIFDMDDDSSMHRVKAILGMVILAIEPVSTAALYGLYDHPDSMDIVDSVLDPLGALLTGIEQKSVPVRPLHTSFHDFLVDASRSKSFHVNSSSGNKDLLIVCLRTMKEGLRFNICQLETSYLLNEEVSDLSARIEAHLPPHLSYACQFFAYHLQATRLEDNTTVSTPSPQSFLSSLTQQISQLSWRWPQTLSKSRIPYLNDIWEFMRNNFLYWVEVLSLIGAVEKAKESLEMIQKWSTVDDDLALFVTDAQKFVETFQRPISESTPHIYLSALPLEPETSLVSKTYLPSFPNTFSINRRTPSHDWVMAIAISPDGRHVVSGSGDATILMWDVATGEIAAGPFYGHEDWVWSLAFSPDGSRICSGSRDSNLRLWEVAQPDMPPIIFQGHQRTIQSVSFSPDSRYIASGSIDGTVRIWDTSDPTLPPKIYNDPTGGAITAVLSRDGTRILSGSSSSDSGTLMGIWDWDSNTPTTVHLSDKGPVVSARVTISPDGRYFASTDKITVWETESHRRFTLPCDYHVLSLTFSLDGTHIASSGFDGQVSVWDLQTRTCIMEARRHGSHVTSVSFTPDGTHLVSGSRHGTIHVDTIGGSRFGHSQDRLFWVSTSDFWGTGGFWWTVDAKYMGDVPDYTLNLARFVHGTSWTKCFEKMDN